MNDEHRERHYARDGRPIVPGKPSAPSGWKRIFCAVIGHDPVMHHGRAHCARCGGGVHVERHKGWRPR